MNLALYTTMLGNVGMRYLEKNYNDFVNNNKDTNYDGKYGVFISDENGGLLADFGDDYKWGICIKNIFCYYRDYIYFYSFIQSNSISI